MTERPSIRHEPRRRRRADHAAAADRARGTSTATSSTARSSTRASGSRRRAWRELEIERIAITHFHPDHVGGAEAAAAESGATVYQGGLDYAQCERVWGSHDWPERIADWFLTHGVPEPIAHELIEQGHAFASFVRFAHDPELLYEGSELDGWSVLELPGHADGHIGFLRDGVLIGGDHLLARITPAVGLYPESRPDPLGDYLASLERTAELGLRIVYPGPRRADRGSGREGAGDRRAPPPPARRRRAALAERAAQRLRGVAGRLRRRACAAAAPVCGRRGAFAPRAARARGPRGAQRGRPDRHLYCAVIATWTIRSVPAPRRAGHDTPLRAHRRRGADPVERILRRRRVRPRHGAANAPGQSSRSTATGARARCSRITDSPPRFIAAMQLGVTLTSLAIGALGEHALAKPFDPVLATVARSDPGVPDPDVPPRRDR